MGEMQFDYAIRTDEGRLEYCSDEEVWKLRGEVKSIMPRKVARLVISEIDSNAENRGRGIVGHQRELAEESALFYRAALCDLLAAAHGTNIAQSAIDKARTALKNGPPERTSDAKESEVRGG